MFLLLVPRASSAIDLHWSDGSLARTFTEATRCTLEVRADSTEQQLPAEWRLLWVADTNTVVTPVPLSTSLDCEADVAKVESLDAPANAADSAAHLLTAHFCSAGETAATLARYALDLGAGSSGKLKVVALDPDDSTEVLTSNEVTFNGGRSDEYPAVVLRAMSDHNSLQYQLTAIGSGLQETRSISLGANDGSWSLPLSITSASENFVIATGSVAAVLPACRVSLSAGLGGTSEVMLAAEQEPSIAMSPDCSAQFFETLLWPAPPLHGYTIQPKDFALTRGFVDATDGNFALHLFYIRQTYYNVPADSNSRNIGHAWTTDFGGWYGPAGLNQPDTVALVARPGKFDGLHVWAPTIVQRGPTFWMFYTGVTRDQPGAPDHQRIGVATSTDLNTWTPQDVSVLSAPDIPWAKKAPPQNPYLGAQQLRDPFVMEDPITQGWWLMYFVSIDSLRSPKMAVGVARSSDLLHWTADPKPITSTERPTFQGETNVVESPHVFRRNGKWWMPYTVNNNQVFFETTTSADPADTVATHWTEPVWLPGAAQSDPPPLQYWHATEYLQINHTEYLSAYNDNATSIDIFGLFAPTTQTDSLRLNCPLIASVDGGRTSVSSLRMTILSRGSMGRSPAFRIELPSRSPVRLAIYDVAGRRLSTLVDRELAAGVHEVAWDGRDQNGVALASGVYFARVTAVDGARAGKILLLR